MRLNGWVRLWIVLSVCWLVSIGYFAYKGLFVLYEMKKFVLEVSREEGWEATFLTFPYRPQRYHRDGFALKWSCK